jgi:hypothetical protein
MDGKRFGVPFPLAAGKNGVAARAEVVCGKLFIDAAPWLARFLIALPADGAFLPEAASRGVVTPVTVSPREVFRVVQL